MRGGAYDAVLLCKKRSVGLQHVVRCVWCDASHHCDADLLCADKISRFTKPKHMVRLTIEHPPITHTGDVMRRMRSVCNHHSQIYNIIASTHGMPPIGVITRMRSACNHHSNIMLPERRFWKDEQKMKCGFSIDFSMARSPNRVITPSKMTSKPRISYFVHPSKIFVWGA